MACMGVASLFEDESPDTVKAIISRLSYSNAFDKLRNLIGDPSLPVVARALGALVNISVAGGADVVPALMKCNLLLPVVKAIERVRNRNE